MKIKLFLFFYFLLYSCQSPDAIKTDYFDNLSSEEKRLPENATLGLKVMDDLEVSLLAAEPLLINPTNIDVDHLGRVWVCEAYNYRPEITGNAIDEDGDKIIFLEDTNGDGLLDHRTVFYQGPEINSPLGIWVMGNQVIVSQSPYVWLFTDEDGDGVADKKEIIFQGISGEQHDHGIHSFIFGPDGKFYFTFGNEGKTLKDKDGNIIRDKNTGKEISPKNFHQGIVFRCNRDFSDVEVLGQNFRNNYEAAVDSYGTIWQSDNDDDGNKAVRINYVMEYGNYGFVDEMSGAGWRVNRTNMETEIPMRHWHQNDPGVIPNLLMTGAGSPTGMVIYEGRLLPEIFWDQMIHADALPRVIRSYPVESEGAGYRAEISNILEGDKDEWFRPSDVCVASDGSLIISDWYDPGVGGHQIGDLKRGRIFRIAPKNSTYSPAQFKYDTSTIEGAIEALMSPNLSWRYQGWTALNNFGSEAEEYLNDEFENNENPRKRARVLWLLSKIDGRGQYYINKAINDSDPNIRITAIRAARQLNLDVIPFVKSLISDKEPQVRRELAIALKNNISLGAADLWTDLALQYDGEDRWYLEALGIGAEEQWDTFFDVWIRSVDVDKDLSDNMVSDIIWRSRTKSAIPFLKKLASDSKVEWDQRLRYFRAFDFIENGKTKSLALIEMLEEDKSGSLEFKKLIIKHLDPDELSENELVKTTLYKILDETYGTEEYIEYVDKYKLERENKRLLDLVLSSSDNSLGRSAANILIKQEGGFLLENVLNSGDENKINSVLHSIRNLGSEETLSMLQNVMFDESFDFKIREGAATALGQSYTGAPRVLNLLKEEKIPENLIPAAVDGVKNAWQQSIRLEAEKYLPDGGKKNESYDVEKLKNLAGDPKLGADVFMKTCSICHQVNGEGIDFGPGLSEIGTKLSKEALYEAILDPDAGINFGYEGYIIELKNGNVNAGIISSKTENEIHLKLANGNTERIETSNIESITQMENSMMPAGLEKGMSQEELVGLVEYLALLK